MYETTPPHVVNFRCAKQSLTGYVGKQLGCICVYDI